jgi:hypothetical protein
MYAAKRWLLAKKTKQNKSITDIEGYSEHWNTVCTAMMTSQKSKGICTAELEDTSREEDEAAIRSHLENTVCIISDTLAREIKKAGIEDNKEVLQRVWENLQGDRTSPTVREELRDTQRKLRVAQQEYETRIQQLEREAVESRSFIPTGAKLLSQSRGQDINIPLRATIEAHCLN